MSARALPAALLACCLAAAEEAAREDAIVVTGEQIARDLQATLAGVSVLTVDDLDRLGGQPSLNDVLRRQANVAVTDGQILIRGLGNYEGENASPLVSVTVDEAWVSRDQNRRGWSPTRLWDLDQVEVLRGPQSSERGANSLGGAVILRTADPTFWHTGRARLVSAGYGTWQCAAAHGGPLIDDVLAFRVAVDWQQSDGFLADGSGRDDYGRWRAATGRAKLLWRPTGDEERFVKLTLSRTDALANNQNVDGVASDPSSRRPEQAFLGHPNIDMGTVASSAVAEAGWRLDERWRLAGTSAWSGYATDADFSPIGSPDDFRYADDALTQELKLHGAFDACTVVGGLYLARYRNRFEGVQGGGVVDMERESVRDAVAVFASADWAFRPRWTLSGGLRLEHERSHADFASVVFGSPADGSDARGGAVALPRAGLRWEFVDDVSIGLQVARGYRGGGLSYDFLDFGGFHPYDPEFAWNYEAALRSRLLERQLLVNLNAFYLDWRDKQIYIAQGSGLPDATENAGRAHAIGAEASIAWRPAAIPGFGVELSAGLMRTRFDAYDRKDGGDYAGNEFPYAPRRTLAAGVHYHAGVGPFGGVEVAHQGEAYEGVDNDPARTVFGATTVDIRAGWAWEAVELSAFCSNLTDEFAYLRRPSDYYVVVSDPRVAGVQLDARW